MAKFGIKKAWAKLTSSLIDQKARERTFVFLSTFIFTYIALGCAIVNFITKEYLLGYITLGCFVAFFAMEILQGFVFTKYEELNNHVLSIPVSFVLLGMVVCYLFLAPARSIYIFWICVISNFNVFNI